MLATQDVYPSSTAHLSNDERRERLLHKRHIIDLQELPFPQEAPEFAPTNAWEEDGSVSAIDWLRFNCKMTTGAAANSIAVGETMNLVPESTQAVTDDEIGYAHLTTIVRTADAVGARFEEKRLVEKARESSPGKVFYLWPH